MKSERNAVKALEDRKSYLKPSFVADWDKSQKPKYFGISATVHSPTYLST